jgi:hypothetical protein
MTGKGDEGPGGEFVNLKIEQFELFHDRRE